MIVQKELSLPRKSRGIYLITDYILNELGALPDLGILHVFIKHSSAALTLNENADPDVRTDMESFLDQLVPDQTRYFLHTMEGADDMPAHVKSSLLSSAVSIPISNSRLNLGTWQGIYFCEFRNHAAPRKLVLTIYS